MNVSIDANILVCVIDTNDAHRHSIARSIFGRVVQCGRSAVCEQTLFEFVVASTRQRVADQKTALALIENWTRALPVIEPPPAALARAVGLLRSFHLQVWDARLLATCAEHGIDTLLSEDMQDGGQYGSVRVLNPFNPANDKIIAALLT